MRALVVLMLVLAGCNERDVFEARIDAERMTGHLMVCDGNKDIGYVCIDGRGTAVYCPADTLYACSLIAALMPPTCLEAPSAAPPPAPHQDAAR